MAYNQETGTWEPGGIFGPYGANQAGQPFQSAEEARDHIQRLKARNAALAAHPANRDNPLGWGTGVGVFPDANGAQQWGGPGSVYPGGGGTPPVTPPNDRTPPVTPPVDRPGKYPGTKPPKIPQVPMKSYAQPQPQEAMANALQNAAMQSGSSSAGSMTQPQLASPGATLKGQQQPNSEAGGAMTPEQGWSPGLGNIPPGWVPDPGRLGGVRPWDPQGFDSTKPQQFYKPGPAMPGSGGNEGVYTAPPMPQLPVKSSSGGGLGAGAGGMQTNAMPGPAGSTQPPPKGGSQPKGGAQPGAPSQQPWQMPLNQQPAQRVPQQPKGGGQRGTFGDGGAGGQWGRPQPKGGMQ
jgi:proline- and glutamine-rich splicing factor